MDEVRDLALRERPKVIFCGGTAIPRTIDFPAFAEIARRPVRCWPPDVAHIAGLIAGGAHPSPAGHADVISTTTHKTLRGPRGAMLMSTAEHATAIDKAVFPGLQGGPHNHTTAAIAVALGEAARRTSARTPTRSCQRQGARPGAAGARLRPGLRGTDNHLILIDLTGKGIAGKPAAQALDKAGIELNYNTVPFDPRKPFDPSGLRLAPPRSPPAASPRRTCPRSPPGWTRPSKTIGSADEETALAKIAAEIARHFLRPTRCPAGT